MDATLPAAPDTDTDALDALRSENAALRARLLRSEARLEAIGRLSADWFWELDATLRFTRCTGGGAHGRDALARLLEHRAPWELPATVPLSGEWDDLHSLLEAGQPFADFVCVTRALGGDERHLSFSGEPLGDVAPWAWQGVARDVTQVHRAQERLRALAHRDRLTGLPNRAATESALQQMIDDAAHDGHRVVAMFVDLDGFKAVNDGLGHAAGDRVLQEAAHRLRTVLREEDVLGRFGGDEFVVALSERRSAGGDLAARTAARLRAAMAAPVLVDGRPCRIGASIGWATFPDEAGDLGALLQRADAAMYEAKRAGRDEGSR
ncbi:MAG TPA: diguanylate cyclase [Burkholderiaceae bacterium]|nr:diguanylate cyclase [Burkholderiaceae bacterium]